MWYVHSRGRRSSRYVVSLAPVSNDALKVVSDLSRRQG